VPRIAGYGLAAIAIGLMPSLAPNPFYIHLGQTFACTAIAVIGLNILLGLSGQMSLGQGGFYALGTYGSAILATTYGWPLAPSILAGVALSFVMGVLVGLVAARTRGLQLAVATLAFGYIVEILAQRWSGLTGGTMGLMGVPQIDFGDFAMGPTYFFWVAAGLLLLVQCGSDYVFASAVGRRLQAVKESEALGATLGLDVGRWRTAVFAASAMLAGLGGALFAHQDGFVSSDAFNIQLTIGMLIAAVIGGLGRSTGPLLGTAILLAITEAIASLHDYGQLLYGGMLLLVLLVFPQGAIGLFGRSWGRRFPLAAGVAVQLGPVRPARLVVEGLTKRYAGVTALTAVDIVVEPGQVHALIGPNGAGKSTFVNVVAGLYAADAGRVVIDGQDGSGLPAYRRARLGLVRTFQNLQLIGGVDVLENVLLGMAPRRSVAADVRCWLTGTAYEAAQRADAAAILDLVGLGGLAQQRPAELSYGHRKRLELARAIAQRPAVLLLDEPVAGLNAMEAQEIAAIVCRLRQAGVAVLLIEHNMEFVMGLSDVVTVLDFGMQIAYGTPAQVQQDPAVRRAYLGTDA